MSKLVTVGVIVWLLTFFDFFIKKFAWILGVSVGLLSSGFNTLSYIGVRCSVIETFSYLLTVLGLFVVIVRVYKVFK